MIIFVKLATCKSRSSNTLSPGLHQRYQNLLHELAALRKTWSQSWKLGSFYYMLTVKTTPAGHQIECRFYRICIKTQTQKICLRLYTLSLMAQEANILFIKILAARKQIKQSIQIPQSVVVAPCNSFKTAGMRFTTTHSPLSSVPDCLYCSVEFGTRSVSLCVRFVCCVCAHSCSWALSSAGLQRPGNAKLTEGKSSLGSRLRRICFSRSLLSEGTEPQITSWSWRQWPQNSSQHR